jgi:hypothetical protein
MTLQEFRQSVSTQDAPPAGLSPLLQALWHDAHGDWDRAHQLAQEVETEAGAWVHAYLHRKEGDASNAGYWYRRASREMFTGTLDDEWADIVDALLDA